MRSIRHRNGTTGVYLTVLAVAVFVRIFLFISYLNSPVRFYSFIPGLDMETILKLGVYFHGGKAVFSIDRFLAMLTYVINGERVWPDAFVAIQLLLGCGTAFFITYIAIKLTGKRKLACLSGVLAATYVPSLIYEIVTLRESIFLFFAVSGLAAVLFVRRRTIWWQLLMAGMVMLLPAYLRFSALLWLGAALSWLFLYWKRKKIRASVIGYRIGWIGIGAVIVIITAWGINRCNSGVNDCFAVTSGHIDLVMNIAGRENITEVNPETSINIQSAKSARYLNIIKRIPEHFCTLLKPFEISNNINYYFIKGIIPWLRFLPGSLLVIPLAVTGLIFMLAWGGWYKRDSILFFYLAVYALPLVAYVPLSRYRLVLLPVLCLGIIRLFQMVLYRLKNVNLSSSKHFLSAFAVLAAVVYWVSWPHVTPIRPADFITLGKALEIRDRQITPEIANCYQQAWLLNPDGIAAGLNLGRTLLALGKVKEAEAVLGRARNQAPENFSLSIYYVNSLLANGKARQALAIVEGIREPKKDEARLTYFYLKGECYRICGDSTRARQSFEQALPLAGDAARVNLQRLIDSLR